MTLLLKPNDNGLASLDEVRAWMEAQASLPADDPLKAGANVSPSTSSTSDLTINDFILETAITIPEAVNKYRGIFVLASAGEVIEYLALHDKHFDNATSRGKTFDNAIFHTRTLAIYHTAPINGTKSAKKHQHAAFYDAPFDHPLLSNPQEAFDIDATQSWSPPTAEKMIEQSTIEQRVIPLPRSFRVATGHLKREDIKYDLFQRATMILGKKGVEAGGRYCTAQGMDSILFRFQQNFPDTPVIHGIDIFLAKYNDRSTPDIIVGTAESFRERKFAVLVNYDKITKRRFNEVFSNGNA